MKAGFQNDTKGTRPLTCAQHNSFIIITKLFNKHKMNKVFANAIQNLKYRSRKYRRAVRPVSLLSNYHNRGMGVLFIVFNEESVDSGLGSHCSTHDEYLVLISTWLESIQY